MLFNAQLKLTVVVAAILSWTPSVRGAIIMLFSGSNCEGSVGGMITVPSHGCLSLGSNSIKSMYYSGVADHVEFFISGGSQDSCTNGPGLIPMSPASDGCASAPDGVNWESVAVF